MEKVKDKELWKIAKARVAFKKHLFSYIVVNAFFWILWAISGDSDKFSHVWPVYPTLGWGIGILFNFYGAYYGHKDGMAEKEYQKLIDKKER